jgi:hypothetical protein
VTSFSRTKQHKKNSLGCWSGLGLGLILGLVLGLIVVAFAVAV